MTGIGGIFFKAKDPKALVQWYRRHLGIDIEDTVALITWRGGKDEDAPFCCGRFKPAECSD